MGQIWKNNTTLDDLNKIHRNTMIEHLGIEITEIGSDHIRMKMPVDNRTIQPLGLLHGGASAVLSETAGSTASFLCIENTATHHPVGIEINANHLRSASSGNVTSLTTPIKIGKKLHVWNTDIYDDNNNLICTSRLTVMIVGNRKP